MPYNLKELSDADALFKAHAQWQQKVLQEKKKGVPAIRVNTGEGETCQGWSWVGVGGRGRYPEVQLFERYTAGDLSDAIIHAFHSVVKLPDFVSGPPSASKYTPAVWVAGCPYVPTADIC
jgi:hypothetical protein